MLALRRESIESMKVRKMPSEPSEVTIKIWLADQEEITDMKNNHSFIVCDIDGLACRLFLENVLPDCAICKKKNEKCVELKAVR